MLQFSSQHFIFWRFFLIFSWRGGGTFTNSNLTLDKKLFSDSGGGYISQLKSTFIYVPKNYPILRGYICRFIWPWNNLYLTFAWSLPDLYLTFAWPLPDCSLTFTWPLPEFAWPLPDLCLTFAWPHSTSQVPLTNQHFQSWGGGYICR